MTCFDLAAVQARELQYVDSDEDSDDCYNNIQPEMDAANRNNSNAFLTDKPDFQDGSLFHAMKLPLLIGGLWGLLPLADLNVNDKDVTISWKSLCNFRTFITVLIILLIGCFTMFIGIDFVIEVSQSKSHSMGFVAGKLSGVWFYAAGLFVYVFCLVRSPQTVRFFILWKKLSLKLRTTMKDDGNLKRELNVMCLLVLLSATGENILFHVFSMRNGILLKGLNITFLDFLEDYYASNQFILRFFAYNPIIAISMFLVNKLTLFAWNFGDVLLMMISWALYTRFRALNAFVEQFQDWDLPAPLTKEGTIPWYKLRKNYYRIVKLLDEADKIFYPLIWVSYTTNIFFVCNQLYIGIRNADIKTTAQRVYVVWSFLHLSLRTLTVNLFAARINESSQELVRLLQFCPPQEYYPDARRLERFLASRVIGITANGVFVVTRSFILMVISAIFTLEVVLLQTST